MSRECLHTVIPEVMLVLNWVEDHINPDIAIIVLDDMHMLHRQMVTILLKAMYTIGNFFVPIIGTESY